MTQAVPSQGAPAPGRTLASAPAAPSAKTRERVALQAGGAALAAAVVAYAANILFVAYTFRRDFTGDPVLLRIGLHLLPMGSACAIGFAARPAFHRAPPVPPPRANTLVWAAVLATPLAYLCTASLIGGLAGFSLAGGFIGWTAGALGAGSWLAWAIPAANRNASAPLAPTALVPGQVPPGFDAGLKVALVIVGILITAGALLFGALSHLGVCWSSCGPLAELAPYLMAIVPIGYAAATVAVIRSRRRRAERDVAWAQRAIGGGSAFAIALAALLLGVVALFVTCFAVLAIGGA